MLIKDPVLCQCVCGFLTFCALQTIFAMNKVTISMIINQNLVKTLNAIFYVQFGVKDLQAARWQGEQKGQLKPPMPTQVIAIENSCCT